MDNLFDLPPLPPIDLFDGLCLDEKIRYSTREDGYTADQMQAYARAAVEAEREACANECAKVYHQHIGPQFGEVRYGVAACQSAIRARSKS